jgi:hypothetical protein
MPRVRWPPRSESDPLVAQWTADPETKSGRALHESRAAVYLFPSQLLFLVVLRRLIDFAQYLAIRYTERLADTGAVCSVGSRGDSYDNALAESVIGLYKTELIRKQGPWRSFEQLELATARWVEWYNQRRLHSSIGDVPPAEFESTYYRERAASAVA